MWRGGREGRWLSVVGWSGIFPVGAVFVVGAQDADEPWPVGQVVLAGRGEWWGADIECGDLRAVLLELPPPPWCASQLLTCVRGEPLVIVRSVILGWWEDLGKCVKVPGLFRRAMPSSSINSSMCVEAVLLFRMESFQCGAESRYQAGQCALKSPPMKALGNRVWEDRKELTSLLLGD